MNVSAGRGAHSRPRARTGKKTYIFSSCALFFDNLRSTGKMENYHACLQQQQQQPGPVEQFISESWVKFSEARIAKCLNALFKHVKGNKISNK